MATLLYDITKRCNLECKHCYNSNYFKDKDIDNSAKSVIEFVKLNNISHVHILGGEPLLSEQLWYFIDNTLNSITISINTNGTLLNYDNICKVLSRKKINQLTISIDGHNEDTNAIIRGKGVFDIILKNTKILNDLKNKYNSKLKINMAFVNTPNNVESLSKLALLAKQNNFDRILVSFLYYEGASKINLNLNYNYQKVINNLLILIEKSRKFNIELLLDVKPIFLKLMELKSSNPDIKFNTKTIPCYANISYYYISANNELYPCSPSSKFGGKFMICDLKKENHKLINKLDVVFSNNRNELCLKCKYSSNCHSCPLNIECSQYDMCNYALNEINKKTSAILNKKILRNSNYEIKVREQKLTLVNFKLNKTCILCETCVKLEIIDLNKIYDLTLLELFNYICDKKDSVDDFLFNVLSSKNKNMINLE